MRDDDKINAMQECIEKGHKLQFNKFKSHYTGYTVYLKCRRCEYITYRTATKAETKAIKLLDVKEGVEI